MQDSAPSTASELGAVLGRGGKETDPHGVSSILWTHLVREPRRKTIRAQKKESDGGHLERSEALARRKVSFLQRQGDTDLHASVRSKAVTDACVTELYIRLYKLFLRRNSPSPSRVRVPRTRDDFPSRPPRAALHVP